MNEIINANTDLLPDGYAEWRKDIEHLIEVAKLRTAINVNADTLALYWIGQTNFSTAEIIRLGSKYHIKIIC